LSPSAPADRHHVAVALGKDAGVAAPADPLNRSGLARQGDGLIADGERFDRNLAPVGADQRAGEVAGDLVLADLAAAAGGGEVEVIAREAGGWRQVQVDCAAAGDHLQRVAGEQVDLVTTGVSDAGQIDDVA